VARPLLLEGNSHIESLIKVADDVVDMFDADANANRFGCNSSLALLFDGHLPVGGRGRMTGQGFGIADIYQPLNQLQSIIEFLALSRNL
jgi:hypothetical protein